MAFADPQSVTIAATPVSLPRTGQSDQSGRFTSSDSSVELNISHTYNAKTRVRRRVITLKRSKLVADPMTPSTNVVLQDTVTVSYVAPNQGFTATESKDLIVALSTFLTASSAAATVKWVGGES